MEESSTSEIEELKSTKEKVEYLLAHYPRARDDDTYLCWMYCVKFEGMRTLPLEEFQKLMRVNFETITRARRIVQNRDGKFLPSAEVQAKRLRKREAYQFGIRKI